MLESEFVPWFLLASQLGFVMAAPLLSEAIPDYERKDSERRSAFDLD
jgi:hypothetical protein